MHIKPGREEDRTSYGLYLRLRDTVSGLLLRVKFAASVTHWATTGKTCSKGTVSIMRFLVIAVD